MVSGTVETLYFIGITVGNWNKSASEFLLLNLSWLFARRRCELEAFAYATSAMSRCLISKMYRFDYGLGLINGEAYGQICRLQQKNLGKVQMLF